MKRSSSLLVVLLLMLASLAANAQDYPRGDVDCDGNVNISDVTCLIDNLLAGVPEGDVDQDGAVNISDVTCLIDYLLSGSWTDDPMPPTHEGDWVDLGLPSGTLWATCNVGADKPEDYGDHFAWGETESKNYYYYETYKWFQSYTDTDGCVHCGYTKYCIDSDSGYDGFTDGKTELDPEDDAAYMNWGSSWRMPTKEQSCELVENCSWQWIQRNGVNGYQVTGPNGSTIFLPAAGDRYMGSLRHVGSHGRYWSRTVDSESSDNAYGLYFLYTSYAEGASCYSDYDRFNGYTVRAVRVP